MKMKLKNNRKKTQKMQKDKRLALHGIYRKYRLA